MTTPTEESVRRAVAIQMSNSKGLGLNYNGGGEYSRNA